jgi:hypothetical protein
MGEKSMFRAALGSLVVLAIAACGGGSEDESGDSGVGRGESTTATQEAVGGRERPEGRWTIVTTQVERSDAPDLEPGLSGITLVEVTPACEDGPCDVEVSPAGHEGTYQPEGLTVTDPSDPETQTYVWDEEAGTYTVTKEERTSCTTVELEVVEDAYLLTRTRTLTFTPADGATPAALTGTYTQSATSTPAGEGAGCTPYEETGTVVGSPTGALGVGGDADLAGEYVTTEYVEAVEPAGSRPPGFSGLLPRFTVETADGAHRITGVLAEAAELTEGEAGLSGVTEEVRRPCVGESETPDGFTSTETWTDLAPVALTADGDPILAGRWRLFENPTPAGVDAGCSLSTNTGYLVMVPADSVG